MNKLKEFLRLRAVDLLNVILLTILIFGVYHFFWMYLSSQLLVDHHSYVVVILAYFAIFVYY